MNPVPLDPRTGLAASAPADAVPSAWVPPVDAAGVVDTAAVYTPEELAIMAEGYAARFWTSTTALDDADRAYTIWRGRWVYTRKARADYWHSDAMRDADHAEANAMLTALTADLQRMGALVTPHVTEGRLYGPG